MKFLIITHTLHKQKGKDFFAYEPYVREMNLWLKNATKTKIVAPISKKEITAIESPYQSNTILFSEIPGFHLLTLKNKLITVLKIPIILFKIILGCFWADHIHLRCPGNIGLLGCFVQIFFPSKSKTVKYAGNWDPNSKQPLSYKFQKWILSNTFLTKNCKVLVYGEWEGQSTNIFPFFTASYSEDEIQEFPKKELKQKIKLIYVGAFSKGKQPIKSVKVAEILIKKGFNIELNMFGNGEEFANVKDYIIKNKLQKTIFLHGNQSKEIVKIAYQESHFLVFISKSEGWPKVVAEAMFWSCLPISTAVSCVPFMLANGNRGAIVTDDENDIVATIESYIKDNSIYDKSIVAAKEWSQTFTLEKFEKEIKKLL